MYDSTAVEAAPLGRTAVRGGSESPSPPCRAAPRSPFAPRSRRLRARLLPRPRRSGASRRGSLSPSLPSPGSSRSCSVGSEQGRASRALRRLRSTPALRCPGRLLSTGRSSVPSRAPFLRHRRIMKTGPPKAGQSKTRVQAGEQERAEPTLRRRRRGRRGWHAERPAARPGDLAGRRHRDRGRAGDAGSSRAPSVRRGRTGNTNRSAPIERGGGGRGSGCLRGEERTAGGGPPSRGSFLRLPRWKEAPTRGTLQRILGVSAGQPRALCRSGACRDRRW